MKLLVPVDRVRLAMCKFRPFNRHLLVIKIPQAKIPDLSPVLIPENSQVGNEERYGLVNIICAASDCDRFLLNLNPNPSLYYIQELGIVLLF